MLLHLPVAAGDCHMLPCASARRWADCFAAIRYEAPFTARYFVNTGLFKLPYHVNQNWSEWLASATHSLQWSVGQLVARRVALSKLSLRVISAGSGQVMSHRPQRFHRAHVKWMNKLQAKLG